MGGQAHTRNGLCTLLALAALAGCATLDEGPVLESGGAPIAGLSEGRSAASPEQESVGLLAVSGNAMLLGAPRSEVATIPAAPGLSLDAPAAVAAADDRNPLDPAAPGPALALNAQPGSLPAAAGGSLPAAAAGPLPAPAGGPLPTAVVGPSLSALTGPTQGLLAPATSPSGLLSPVTVGVRSVLTPTTATSPGTATTQLANALVSTVSRASGTVGGAVSPLLPARAPGGAGLGRLVSGLTPPTGN